MTDAERQQMSMDHYYVVKTLAIKYANKSPLGVEELRSIGSVGLAKAAQRYDPDRNATFHTYAYRVVSGHMIDAIRNKLGSRTASFKSTSPFSSFDDPSGEYATTLADPRAVSPSAQAEIKDLVPKLMDILSPNERQVIHLVYFQNTSLTDIADKLRVSTSRISQLHAVALQKMRDKDAAMDRGVPARVSVESIVDMLMEEKSFLDFDLSGPELPPPSLGEVPIDREPEELVVWVTIPQMQSELAVAILRNRGISFSIPEVGFTQLFYVRVAEGDVDKVGSIFILANINFSVGLEEMSI